MPATNSLEGPEHAERFCISCGYNLRGLTSNCCPECGLATDTANGASVPWEGRRHIGFFTAFFKTAFQATFRVRQLALAAGHPIDETSAFLFRCTVAGLAALPVAISFLVFAHSVLWQTFLDNWQPDGANWQSLHDLGAWGEPLELWGAGVILAPAVPLGILISLYLLIGAGRLLPSLLPANNVQKSRAAIASAYASAPLALIAVPIAAFAVVWPMSAVIDPFFHSIVVACLFVGCISFAAIVCLWHFGTIQMMSLITYASASRKFAAHLMLALLAALSMLIGLVLFPMVIGLVWIMIDSLRS